MEIKGVTRREIEAKLNTLGDYVKMEYLNKCLSQNIDFDTRKFVLSKLSSIYELKGMFGDAAKLMSSAAEINAAFDGKINDFMKSMELFAKAGLFDESEVAFSKALVCSNERQKSSLKIKRKEIYRGLAKYHMDRDKRKHAMVAYEKMLKLDIDSNERREIQNTLLQLYEKLGKIREFYNLKKSMESGEANPPAQQPRAAPVQRSEFSGHDFVLD